MTAVIARNNIAAKLVKFEPDTRAIIADLLAFDVDGSEHTDAYQLGIWNGRKTFLRPDDTFEAGFIDMIRRVLRERGIPVSVLDYRPKIEVSAGDFSLIGITPYDYQVDAALKFLEAMCGVIKLATGGGKCLGRDTPVLMLDGSTKMVQDVKVGDQLIGPDSLPRNVLSVTAGQSKLYRIVPTKGDPYVVNDSHILSLKTTKVSNRQAIRPINVRKAVSTAPKGNIVNIPVEEYLTKHATFKHCHKGWRSSVDFAPGNALKIDPYFLGLWLGDGRLSGPEITTGDAEIEIYLHEYAASLGLMVKSAPNSPNSVHLRIVNVRGAGNPLLAALKEYGLIFGQFTPGDGAKHIPADYLRASREDRLRLLAGIIDTDGHYDGKGLYLTLKSERLIDDVIFLARSLGFAAYKRQINKTCYNNGVVGSYFATVICGHIEQVPTLLPRKQPTKRLQKKDPLVHGIRVEDAGYGDYFGFELDGDKLFLLGDFTVTHNTEIFMMLAKYLGLPTLFLTHKIDLVDQTAERIRQRLGRQVGTIAEGSWNPSEITVASVQTIMSHWQIWWRVEGEGITKKSDGAIVPMSKTLQAATQLEAAASAKALGMTRITAINVHRDDRLIVDNFLMSIRFFVADEAHRVSGASFFKIAGATRSANYRLGLSATAGLKESREDNLKLIAATGDIIVHIGVKQLVDSGHLAQPRFKLQQVPMPRGVYKSTAWQQAYDAGIVRNDIRNAMVLEAAWNERSRKPIVLVQREDHGNRLLEIAKAHGMNALWIYGKTGTPKTKTKVRREALDQLRDGQIDAIICSTIFDEGVDEKSIGCIVNGGGMKSLIGLYQRVGRGSRLKRDGRAEELVVYDFIDMLNMHLLKHSAMRYRAISEEEGWIIDEIRLWEESRRSGLLMSWGPQSSIPPVMFNGRQISLSF